MNNGLQQVWIPLHVVCKIVNRTAQSLRNDARAKLLTITKQPGVRSPLVRADRLNAYIWKKHFGKVEPVTVESLQNLSGWLMGSKHLGEQKGVAK